MPLTRKAVALLILTALSMPIAFALGEYLGIKSDTGIETIPSTFIDPVLAFYSVPIRVTVAFLADVTPAAPLWIWTAIMFAGVLVQHFVLYGVTTRLIHFAKTPRMAPTSSMDPPLSDRVALKDEANANRTTGPLLGLCPSCGLEIPMDSKRCSRCNAIFMGLRAWKPVQSGSQIVGDFSFRGSTLSVVVFALYFTIVIFAVAVVHADTHSGGMWTGLLSIIVLWIVGLPTNLLIFALPISWLPKGQGEFWLAWFPIAFNLLFLGWLAFSRPKVPSTNDPALSNGTVERDTRKSRARPSL